MLIWDIPEEYSKSSSNYYLLLCVSHTCRYIPKQIFMCTSEVYTHWMFQAIRILQKTVFWNTLKYLKMTNSHLVNFFPGQRKWNVKEIKKNLKKPIHKLDYICSIIHVDATILYSFITLEHPVSEYSFEPKHHECLSPCLLLHLFFF